MDETHSLITLPFPLLGDYMEGELEARFSLDCSKATRLGEALFFSNISDEKASLIFKDALWSRCIVKDPKTLNFQSIKDAAIALRAQGRNWAPYSYQLFRRTALISDNLPHIQHKPRTFGATLPKSPMGFFTLTSDHTALYSALTNSSLPLGTLTFIEDHISPPSRAYLKMEEALTVAKSFLGFTLPNDKSTVFDAGASPGGWTYVFRLLGAKVIACDRSELANALMKDEKVRFLQHDAFTLKPCDIGKCDLVASDVAAYPTRLLEWVEQWIESGLTKQIIATIKLQALFTAPSTQNKEEPKGKGQDAWAVIKKLCAIKGAHVRHLNYNKHELTFFWRGEGEGN